MYPSSTGGARTWRGEVDELPVPRRAPYRQHARTGGGAVQGSYRPRAAPGRARRALPALAPRPSSRQLSTDAGVARARIEPEMTLNRSRSEAGSGRVEDGKEVRKPPRMRAGSRPDRGWIEAGSRLDCPAIARWIDVTLSLYIKRPLPLYSSAMRPLSKAPFSLRVLPAPFVLRSQRGP